MQNRLWLKTLITFVTSVTLSFTALAASPFDIPPGLVIAQEVQEKYGDSLMQSEGVVGHGLSFDQNGKGVIVVFTETPMAKNIPKVLEQVPVKPVFTGRFYSLAKPLCGGPPSERPPECSGDEENTETVIDPKTRFTRPVPIGVSSGHPDITAGTIGARVTDGDNVYALSNNHVFANSNDAVIGDPILQPGPLDGGSEPNDTFAHLTKFAEIVFGGTANQMDAALSLTTENDLTTSTPEGGYGTPNSVTASPFVTQEVQKYGRTTGFTQGVVDSVNATISVCYEGVLICTKSATFVDQFVITPGTFSAGGDSGSLIVAMDNSPVGLLFAGSSSYTIATPIDTVLKYFGVSIDSDTSTPPPSSTIELSAYGYKEKGLQKALLEWKGSTGTVDVYRDSEILQSVESTRYLDDINQKGGASYIYWVCNQDGDTCSNRVNVNF